MYDMPPTLFPMRCESLPRRLTLLEVAPRDGLQNEKSLVSADIKIELCHRLLKAGARRLEVTSFVSPRWVPQMADGAQVLAGLTGCIPLFPGVAVSALVPNLKGLEAALEVGLKEIVIFTAASESFVQKNINCSIAESIERFKPVVNMALAHGMHVRGAISCALGCPYQGEVAVSAVVEVAKHLRDIGTHELDVADTLGTGTPVQVQKVFEAVAKVVSRNRIAGHFHDTYGQALANILACLQVGIHTFHSAVAGLGGCPYAQGATGNVATEDVVYMLQGMGIECGLDLTELVRTGSWISKVLGKPYASRAGRALALRFAQ